MILGIDTSAGQCAVALMRGGEVRARRAEPMSRGHADRLFPMIEEALAACGASYREIARIGVCTGPGSFTGIRVGVSAARGLALGLGVPAIGIDRFEALRAAAVAAPEGAPVAVAIAGPRDIAYLRLHDPLGARLGEDAEVPPDALEALAPAGALRLGDGWPGAVPEAGMADPAVIARLAGLARPDAAGAPVPAYLRGPNADLPRTAPPPRIG